MATKLAGKVISEKNFVTAKEKKTALDKQVREQNKRWEDKLKNK